MRHAGEEFRRRARRRGLVTIAACAAVALVVPGVAFADNHEVKLRELYAGSTASPNDEYVELQLYEPGENLFSEPGVTLHLYDASGNQTLAFHPPTDVPNAQSQRRALFATPTAATTFGVMPDYTLPAGDHINDAGGAVCYVSATAGFVDCVSWGNFHNTSGTPLPSKTGGNVNPMMPGIPDGMAIDRSIKRGCATLLEAGDDTNSPSNWADGAPDPLNNAARPHEHPCANTIITKAPKSRTTDRTPKFKFTSSRKPATFKCKLDSKPFKKCTSPLTTKRLKLGKHVFKVKATFKGGTDPTPAVKRFKVVRHR
jgi:hypothetical protein